MSDTRTPLTDAATMRYRYKERRGEYDVDDHFDYVEPEFAKELERKAAHFDALREALSCLLGEVESLDDYSLTRDIEPHKAQACWDYVIDQARTALLEATEAAK